MPGKTQSRKRIETVRAFNRFYTRHVGALNEGLLDSPWTLTEVRVLYEIAHGDAPTATEIGSLLQIDAGYLSRILRAFHKRGLIRRTRSAEDGRETHLSLTAKGRRVFDPLDARARDEVAAALQPFPPHQQERLLGAMRTIRDILEPEKTPPDAASFTLRRHRPGDMGWVVHRHGTLYYEEYGWDEKFEGLVAGIVARFIEKYDREHERCWIAERDAAIIGSVFMVRKSPTVAQLRLLFVEPSARGLGLGNRLVDECIEFAREVGYRKITLWTHSNLVAARHIYQQKGFTRVHVESYHAFGQELENEVWELPLQHNPK
jgi:DNA-binding MarR family transcriptional regulator/N-acetylglutamate synthase-like GNAT family acetyltransferase